jgi:hypothetical protein
MNERLSYLADLLESGGDLPAASRQWLLEALRQIDQGTDPRTALGLPEPTADSRNQVLRQYAQELPGSPWRKAQVIADQARRIHRGRKAAMPWIIAADRLRPIPETQRQIYNILKTRP